MPDDRPLFESTLTTLADLSRTLELVLTDPVQQVSFLHAAIGSLMDNGASARGHLIYADDADDLRVLFCGGPLWAIDPHELVGRRLRECLPDDAERLTPHYRQGLASRHQFDYAFEGAVWRTMIRPLGIHSGRRCAHLWFYALAPKGGQI